MKLDNRLIQKTKPNVNPKNVILFKDYRFSILTPNLIRIEKGTFLDDATITVFYRETKEVNYSYKTTGETITIETDKIIMVYDTLKEYKDNYMIFKEDKSKEKRYLNNDYNLKGTMRTLDTFFDGGFCVDKSVTDFKIETLPLENGVLSKNGVSIIDDKLSPVIKEDGLPYERLETEEDIYVFMYLNDYYGALRDFYLIAGYTPLVPRFALGNWWSRYHPYTQNEYLGVLDRFLLEEVPLSIATIDMDWHYTDIEKDFKLKELNRTDISKYGATWGWTGYSWNKNLWPDYKKALEEIKDRGLYITLNLHPKDGIRWFEDMYKDMAKAMNIDPNSLKPIEFDFTSPDYLNNYFRYVMHPYEKDGVDFWWIDYQQERFTKIKNLDPLWPLNHYHYLDNKNNLILSRYAGLGSHRYPLGFSGDTKMTWEFLDFMPYFTFTASNAGYTWWSHDIGAHHYGIKDDDLYLRWIEFGVFSPINRIHGNLMDVVSKEPWLNKSSVRFITDYYLRLRHRLIPYIYHYSHLTKEEGIPLIRPLYYDNPLVKEAYKDNYTYYFGETIVSPITTKSKNGYSIKSFYLPEGKYYDYITRRFYKGNRYIKIARDTGEIPFLMKEGTIIPLMNDIKNFSDMPRLIEINVIGGNAHLSLRESNEYELTTDITSELIDDKLVLTIQSQSGLICPRKYTVFFRSYKDAKARVFVDNHEEEFTYNRAYSIGVAIQTQNVTSSIKVVLEDLVEYTFKDYLDEYALNILTGENDINEEKQKIFEYIRDNIHTKEELKKYISSSKMNKNLKVRLLELTYFE